MYWYISIHCYHHSKYSIHVCSSFPVYNVYPYWHHQFIKIFFFRKKQCLPVVFVCMYTQKFIFYKLYTKPINSEWLMKTCSFRHRLLCPNEPCWPGDTRIIWEAWLLIKSWSIYFGFIILHNLYFSNAWKNSHKL